MKSHLPIVTHHMFQYVLVLFKNLFKSLSLSVYIITVRMA